MRSRFVSNFYLESEPSLCTGVVLPFLRDSKCFVMCAAATLTMDLTVSINKGMSNCSMLLTSFHNESKFQHEPAPMRTVRQILTRIDVYNSVLHLFRFDKSINDCIMMTMKKALAGGELIRALNYFKSEPSLGAGAVLPFMRAITCFAKAATISFTMALAVISRYT